MLFVFAILLNAWWKFSKLFKQMLKMFAKMAIHEYIVHVERFYQENQFVHVCCASVCLLYLSHHVDWNLPRIWILLIHDKLVRNTASKINM